MACVEIVRRTQAPTGPLPVTDLCRRRTCNAWFVSTASENGEMMSFLTPPAAMLLGTSAIMLAVGWPPMSPAAQPAPAGTVSQDTTIRPFQAGIPDEQLVDLRRRIAATRWPDRETVADRSQGVQLAKFQELVALLGHRLRLAQGGSEAECPAAVHDRDRRRRHSLHPCPLEASECAAADHHAWLAGLDHRAAQDHRSAHRSHGAWRHAQRTPSIS